MQTPSLARSSQDASEVHPVRPRAGTRAETLELHVPILERLAALLWEAFKWICRDAYSRSLGFRQLPESEAQLSPVLGY